MLAMSKVRIRNDPTSITNCRPFGAPCAMTSRIARRATRTTRSCPRIGHASTASSVRLPKIVAMAAPWTPQWSPRIKYASRAMFTALPHKDARIGVDVSPTP